MSTKRGSLTKLSHQRHSFERRSRRLDELPVSHMINGQSIPKVFRTQDCSRIKPCKGRVMKCILLLRIQEADWINLNLRIHRTMFPYDTGQHTDN